VVDIISLVIQVFKFGSFSDNALGVEERHDKMQLSSKLNIFFIIVASSNKKFSNLDFCVIK
jgi:hypothetical protein